MVKNIDFSQISVVLQGAIDHKIIDSSIKGIRENLPGASIILSTWKGTDTSNLDVDQVVLSDDPGAVIHDFKNRVFNNLNRQLVSTQEGLKKVNTKYCLKFRTDLELVSSEFVHWFSCFPERSDQYAVFKNRIVVSSIYSRFLHKDDQIEQKSILHPSDWALFGLTEDLLIYFLESPLVLEPNYSFYFYGSEKLIREKRVYRDASWRFPPEQYICQNFFAKYFPEFGIENYTVVSDELFELSQKVLVNNFIFLDPDQWRLVNLKRQYYKYTRDISKMGGVDFSSLYRNYLFLSDYKRFCDPMFDLPEVDEKLVRNRKNFKNRLVRFFRRIGIYGDMLSIYIGIRAIVGSVVSIFFKLAMKRGRN